MLGSVEDDYSEGNLHSNKTRIKQENVRIMKQRDAFMDARNKGIPPYGTSISLGAFRPSHWRELLPKRRKETEWKKISVSLSSTANDALSIQERSGERRRQEASYQGAIAPFQPDVIQYYSTDDSPKNRTYRFQR
jgi:hypothetical protein